jgi:hypothetical protein
MARTGMEHRLDLERPRRHVRDACARGAIATVGDSIDCRWDHELRSFSEWFDDALPDSWRVPEAAKELPNWINMIGGLEICAELFRHITLNEVLIEKTFCNYRDDVGERDDGAII